MLPVWCDSSKPASINSFFSLLSLIFRNLRRKGREEMCQQVSLLLLGLSLGLVTAFPSQQPDAEKHWVLIVAGSNGWFNYRHQVRKRVGASAEKTSGAWKTNTVSELQRQTLRRRHLLLPPVGCLLPFLYVTQLLHYVFVVVLWESLPPLSIKQTFIFSI